MEGVGGEQQVDLAHEAVDGLIVLVGGEHLMGDLQVVGAVVEVVFAAQVVGVGEQDAGLEERRALDADEIFWGVLDLGRDGSYLAPREKLLKDLLGLRLLFDVFELGDKVEDHVLQELEEANGREVVGSDAEGLLIEREGVDDIVELERVVGLGEEGFHRVAVRDVSYS